jgi:hypothetical protein
MRTERTERNNLLLGGEIRNPAARDPSTLLPFTQQLLAKLLRGPVLFNQ